MTFTKDEVDRMLTLSKEYVEMIDKLTPYCEVIAKALGFDHTDGVWAGTTGTGDHITFMCEWHGPYQAHNRESFCFPAAMLSMPAEEVAAVLVEQRKRQCEEAKRKQDEYLQEKKHQDYLKLKAEFEPAN